MQNIQDCRSGEHKIESYYGPYQTHFGPLTDEKLKILEIGVQNGGSLAMWRKMFPESRVEGVDIDPACREHATKDSPVHIGDQADVDFISQFKEFDIIIDDGGHTMHQHQVTFNTLFPLMNEGGIYVIEDLHTAYWPQFRDTNVRTTDFIAELIDELNRESLSSKRAEVDYRPGITGKIAEIHFYPSICFIIKK